MKIIFLYLNVLVACCLLLVAIHASASSRLYLDQTGPAAAGGEFSMRVLLDTDEAVNAYSVNLKYATEFLEPAGFNDSRSIIGIWKDKIAGNGEIKLSGGSFTPFKGKEGEIITLNFKATQEGAAAVAFGASQIYLADGKGTEVLPEIGTLHIAIGVESAASAPSAARDTAPPQIKILSMVPDPFNEKQKLLTFLAADADSGLKKTEIRTISYLWPSWWASVANPAPLSASVWAVEFKATDNNGNSVRRVLFDWAVFIRSLAEMAFVVIVLILLAFPVFSRMQRKN